MSDTLPEREDEIMVHKDDAMRKDSGLEDDWCDDCHGYTHMPWCPAYKEPVKEAGWCPVCGTLNCVNPANHQTATNEYEPPMTDQDKIGVLVRATGEETLIGALHWIQKQRGATEHQPAARGGGDDSDNRWPQPWQVRQTVPSDSRSLMDSQGRLLANVISEDLAEYIRGIVEQHHSLVAERERLLAALRQAHNAGLVFADSPKT